MAKYFREFFFENNTSHLVAKTSWQKLRGKKFLWQKNFAKYFLKTILFTFVAKNLLGKKKFRGKKFRGKKISWKKILWKKFFLGINTI